MPFQLVYLSQQDPKWKSDLLGFGDPGDTIGYIGCALTATAMLLSGHGYAETPKSLNQKLKNVGGFVSAAIVWGAVSKIHPNVTLKAFIPCANSDAPLAQIDAAIAAGQPAIVQVDRSPASGIQTHWVVLYKRDGDDYLMLDPWPYQPDTSKPDYLMKRYAHGMTLRRAISHVILYEAIGSGGPISTAPSTPTTTTPPSQPTPAPAAPGGATARIKAEVTWGLNLRSSADTSSSANILAVLPAGTLLSLLEADGYARVGAINQMLRVRTPGGQEGYLAAWYLEKVSAGTPPVVAAPTAPESEAPAAPPAPAPTTPSPPPAQPEPSSSIPPAAPPAEPPQEEKLFLTVSKSVGSGGLRLRQAPSLGGALITVLKAGTRLTVIEPVDKARAKIGRAHQWIHVREPLGRRGYVSAEFVQLA
jgi:hypothetical protein